MTHRSVVQVVGEGVLVGRVVGTAVAVTVGLFVEVAISAGKVGIAGVCIAVEGTSVGSGTTSVEAAAGTQAARLIIKQNEPRSVMSLKRSFMPAACLPY
jgi:hypothetical protein